MQFLPRSHVALLVQGKVIGAREGAIAVRALERLHARVLPKVTGQLIGAGELPRTAFPHALIRLLSCMCASVSFEMGAFGVDFIAPVKVAPMNPTLL